MRMEERVWMMEKRVWMMEKMKGLFIFSSIDCPTSIFQTI